MEFLLPGSQDDLPCSKMFRLQWFIETFYIPSVYICTALFNQPSCLGTRCA